MIRGADPFELSSDASRTPMRYGVAAASLVAFIGLVALSYTLGNRDVANNAVPFIRADGEPVKMRPTNPGGAVFANSDIGTVYARRQGDGVVQPEKLAPEAEQQATVAAKVVYQQPAAPAVPLPTTTITPVQPPAPLVVQKPEPVAVKPAPKPEPVKAEPAPKPVVKVAPKPEPVKIKAVPPVPARPISAILDSFNTPTTPATMTKTTKPVALSGGDTLVQLASVKNQSEAQALAASLHSKFGDIFHSRPHVVRADLGDKGIYYRLRAGFANAEQANKACALLQSRGQSCLFLGN